MGSNRLQSKSEKRGTTSNIIIIIIMIIIIINTQKAPPNPFAKLVPTGDPGGSTATSSGAGS